MNRLIGAVLTVGLTVILSASAIRDQPAIAAAEPAVTLLDMHPVDQGFSQAAKSMGSMPVVNRPGASPSPDPRQIAISVVVTPGAGDSGDPGAVIGKAGTGFFVGDDEHHADRGACGQRMHPHAGHLEIPAPHLGVPGRGRSGA